MAEKKYIDREAAIKAVSENDCEGYATQAVKAIPISDVRPVVRGEWEEEDSASNRWSFRCSVCGEGGRGYKFNFCPNCGADMKGENDG